MNFLPSYLGNKAMLWDAKILTLYQDTLQSISLVDTPVNNSDGQSVITGVLLKGTEAGNGKILEGNTTEEGEVLAGIPVYLMHPDTREILYYAITDQQGKFSFTDLQAGDYLFLADHEGLPNDEEQNLIPILTDFETVTITAIAVENIRITDVQTEKQVTALEDEIPHHTIQYYPNPVIDELSIVHTSSWLGGEIRISDSSGKLLRTQKISSGSTKMNVRELNNGIYIITLTKANTYHSFKIFKR